MPTFIYRHPDDEYSIQVSSPSPLLLNSHRLLDAYDFDMPLPKGTTHASYKISTFIDMLEEQAKLHERHVSDLRSAKSMLSLEIHNIISRAEQ